MNIIENLLIVIGDKFYKVSVDKSGVIVKSEMEYFNGKNSSDLFRWARCRKAKIFNTDCSEIK